MDRGNEIKRKEKDEESFRRSNKSKISLKIQVKFIYFSFKALRVEDQNKIQNGNCIFLEGLRFQGRLSRKSIYKKKSGLTTQSPYTVSVTTNSPVSIHSQTTISPASETPFEWRFAGMPILASCE